MLKWSATEIVGVNITNPRPVMKIPLTPEMLDKWEREAKAQGLTLDEYLDRLFEVRGGI